MSRGRAAAPAGHRGAHGGTAPRQARGGAHGRSGSDGDASDEGSSDRSRDARRAADKLSAAAIPVSRWPGARAVAAIVVLAVVVATGARWWSSSPPSPAAAVDGGARASARDATAVQLWFEEHKEGIWREYASKFERLNVEEMSELSKEAFINVAESPYGGAIYNDWRATVTCCAAGWADVLWFVWLPRGLAVALVVVKVTEVVWAVQRFIQRARVEAVQRESELNYVEAPAEFVVLADALRRHCDQKRTQLTAGEVVDFDTLPLMYVREYYVPLMVEEPEYINDDVNPTRCRVHIGNPGIDKSDLRLLVACKALAEGLDVAFVKKFDGHDHKMYIVSADGRHDRVRAKGASVGNFGPNITQLPSPANTT